MAELPSRRHGGDREDVELAVPELQMESVISLFAELFYQSVRLEILSRQININDRK